MDRAAILACLIMVVGVVMYSGTAQPSIRRNACRFMLAPRLGKVIVSVDVAVGSCVTSYAGPHGEAQLYER